MKHFLLLAAFLLPSSTALTQDKPIEISVSKFGSEVRLIGTLGKVFTLQGVVVAGSTKAQSGPQIRALRINGQATQQDIVIQPHGSEWGRELTKDSDLIYGKCYEWEGYETGNFVGMPDEVFKQTKERIATTGFYFRSSFIYHKSKEIDPIRAEPFDFVGRKALIAGKAISVGKQSYIVAGDWRLLVDSASPWSKDCEGKDAEALGTIKKTDNQKSFRLEDGTTRLVNLEDQLGKKVLLRGVAWSHNGSWCLSYRGQDLYVENLKELVESSPRHLHGNPVEIKGILEKTRLPHPFGEEHGQLSEYYIVRKPTWKPLDSLLAPECGGR